MLLIVMSLQSLLVCESSPSFLAFHAFKEYRPITLQNVPHDWIEVMHF